MKNIVDLIFSLRMSKKYLRKRLKGRFPEIRGGFTGQTGRTDMNLSGPACPFFAKRPKFIFLIIFAKRLNFIFSIIFEIRANLAFFQSFLTLVRT